VAGSVTTNNLGTGTGGATTNNIGNTQPGSSVNMAGGNSTMTLNNSGLTLAQPGSGAPVKIMGVAEGTNPTDAVNRAQLNRAYSGIAGVAAMGQIPQPSGGDQFSMGVGMGGYMGESAMALGMKFRTKQNSSLSFSFTTDSQSRSVVAAGAGWSF